MTAATLPADIDLLDLHRLDPARYPVLLESSATGAHGRRDLLLAHAGEGFALHRDGVVRTLSPERASWHPLRRGSMAGCESRSNSVCTGKLSNCSIS